MTTAEDIKSLGTIMGVWAHPDDESFLAAGLFAAAIANGQKVICVTATKGEAGSQDPDRWPLAKMSTIRANELAKALKVIGVKHHHWLDFPDGGCAKADTNKAVECIVELVQKYQPDTFITFGPDGLTGHPDHSAVSIWVAQAMNNSRKPIQIFHAVVEEQKYRQYLQSADKKLNIFYNIDKPPVVKGEDCDICFELPPSLMQKKMEALREMPSQTGGLFSSFDEGFITGGWSVEAFVKAG